MASRCRNRCRSNNSSSSSSSKRSSRLSSSREVVGVEEEEEERLEVVEVEVEEEVEMPVHYGLRALHLKTRKITAALWTYNMGKNWYSCLLKARKYMVLPAP